MKKIIGWILYFSSLIIVCGGAATSIIWYPMVFPDKGTVETKLLTVSDRTAVCIDDWKHTCFTVSEKFFEEVEVGDELICRKVEYSQFCKIIK